MRCMTRGRSSRARCWTIAVACAVVASCDAAPPATTTGGDVVATVNGVPITELDLLLESGAGGGHRREPGSADDDEMLQKIILRELAYQRAIVAGLDADDAYQEDLQRLEAQVLSFKRNTLAELLYKRESLKNSAISDEDAREYFEDHFDELSTEIHVWQILRRDESLIEQDRVDLAQGDSFEQVAGQRFQHLPQNGSGRMPWDLGYLKWEQVPEVWWDEIDGLEAGETSNIIRGANGRYWIILIVDRRKKQDIHYEDVQAKIKDVLKSRNIRRFRDDLDNELLQDARVVYID